MVSPWLKLTSEALGLPVPSGKAVRKLSGPLWSASVRLMAAAVAPAGMPLRLPVTCTVALPPGPSGAHVPPLQLPTGPKAPPRVS